MSGPTSIQWADAVWNPVRGCTRVSEGCRNCYAERQAARNLPAMRSPTTGKAYAQNTPHGPRWTGKVELIESALAWPLHRRKPLRIFVNSMSDLFHESLSDATIGLIFGYMSRAPQHTFYALTKRAERMRSWMSTPEIDKAGMVGPWPPARVWLGVSVEDQPTADERIPLLLATPAAHRFASYEPALRPADLTNLQAPNYVNALRGGQRDFGLPRLDAVIVGGESGPNARPCDIAWIRSIVRQCTAAGVGVMVKQLGARVVSLSEIKGYSRVPLSGSGADPSEWPADLRPYAARVM